MDSLDKAVSALSLAGMSKEALQATFLVIVAIICPRVTRPMSQIRLRFQARLWPLGSCSVRMAIVMMVSGLQKSETATASLLLTDHIRGQGAGWTAGTRAGGGKCSKDSADILSKSWLPRQL